MSYKYIYIYISSLNVFFYKYYYVYNYESWILYKNDVSLLCWCIFLLGAIYYIEIYTWKIPGAIYYIEMYT